MQESMTLASQAGETSPQSSETLLASTSFFCRHAGSFYFNIQNGCSDLCQYYICIPAERKNKGTMNALVTSL